MPSRNKKSRTSIPSDVAADLLFAADHTCCICNTPGLPVQIHHIDENPLNHLRENLAVLCEHDHDRTMVRGGFGRHLSATEVARYRDDWNRRVIERRRLIDAGAAAMRSRVSASAPPTRHESFISPPSAFIEALPAIRSDAYERSRGLRSGTTVDMRQGGALYIDTLEGVLVALAAYYPSAQFGGESPREYFSSVIAGRYLWHRLHLEPDGPGTGGTIIGVEAAAAVMHDVGEMVVDLVRSLCSRDHTFDFMRWKGRWDEAQNVDSGL
jgi:hypothetical protein